ncbi:MAG: sulfate ABC transporter permease subunit CysW [Thermoguttaceae bacterium]
MPKLEYIAKHENRQLREATSEPFWVRSLLILSAIIFLTLFLLLPLVCIFTMAFKDGLWEVCKAFSDPDSISAITLTLLTAIIVVPLNVAFGLAAAWCIGKFEFRGKGLLITLIDIPFAVSPVIAGLLFAILFGTHSTLGSWFEGNGIKILYAVPGIVMVTTFVTCPFVVRELLPIMQAQGTEEELAARVLGARGWQIFWRVTLPNIKWGLLYGAILCNARAMGEFGAVAVVSGRLCGRTLTLPLHIEMRHFEYPESWPFALAALLASLAIITLIIKVLIETTGQIRSE